MNRPGAAGESPASGRRWHGIAGAGISGSLWFLLPSGFIVGAVAWSGAAAVSGTFEPYDSGVGLLMCQLVLTTPAAWLAFRRGLAVALMLLLAAYAGLNAYVFVFGSTESRAWAGLGALTSTLLFVLPVAIATLAAGLRRVLQAPGKKSPAAMQRNANEGI